MDAQKESLTKAFFASLDSSFVNLEKEKHPLVYSTKDFTVQMKFDLPIPTLPGSIVKYSFSTKFGDISFGAKFFSRDHPAETILEGTRVPSDVESITGTFKSVREGTLSLIFDNSFSWFNSKTLSYKIELFQPAFAVADAARCIKSRSMLSTIVEDTRRAEIRLVRSRERIGVSRLEISVLEEKLAQLTAELASKKNSLAQAFEETEDMSARIMMNLEKKNGLCIRTMNKALMVLMVSFLGGKQSSVSSVCKYWLICANAASENGSAAHK